MRVAFVVLHLGRQELEVVVEQREAEGERRRRVVTLSWYSKEWADVPPADWLAQVRGELDFQDSNPLPFIR